MQKVVLFVPDLGPHQRRLDSDKVPYMRRLSSLSGDSSAMAHLGVAVQGRIYEVRVCCLT
jgi:hypothetical protein